MLAYISSSTAAAFIGGGVAPTSQRAAVQMVATSDGPVTVPYERPDDSLLPSGVLRSNTRARPWVEQRPRPRRNRKTETMRSMVRETIVTPANFIYPLVRRLCILPGESHARG